MTLQQFQQFIKESNFTELFISELGWNKYPSQPLPPFQVGDIVFEIDGIAERNGFQVLISYMDKLPTQTECKALDGKLRRLADSYILIFVENNTNHHLWSVPIKNNEKRQLVFVEYLTSQRLEFLYSKIGELTFDIDEKTYITDVKARVQKAFEVNSEKLTKDFYSGFQKQHKAFCQFITGINDDIPDKENRDKQWYTSVMLNRLMFCYFIQKKGFLNNDKNYLQTKLAWCQLQKGTDQFYSFYKSFLLQLFFGGLNAPKHDTSFEQEFGRIPYLNGGMFDEHQLERDYANIEICDDAFKALFDFFDKWEWHLDTRVTASGRDINPDVLGYIFEQYINDRAQMGAYYTKEDITEYIGKNCILPFLMDRLKEKDAKEFEPDGYVWKTLANSGDKYIYNAVRKGVNSWDAIPEEIAQGIDTTSPNLLDRRVHWNEPTPEQWALPTEIWRESIERMQRCRDIQNKINAGEITQINDFITYNLDIRQFVQDLIEQTDNHLLVKHFFDALKQVSILDPTCGSGAFLFAAMNILEPLYEACLNRMHEFNAQNSLLFKDVLTDLQTKYRSNIQYYIYKTIILNNLYGVDIMHEAVEIAKLRLFLKMVAVVDVDMRADNLGIDPLPDIDFNIRCGNTLVGYANEEQLKNDLAYGDMFAQLEFQSRIESEMELVAQTFKRFRGMQLSQNVDDLQEFKEVKHELNTRLAKLNDTLNNKMYQSITAGGQSYESWLKSHQPFHWLAEYYHIIKGNGGFDVIIGNPPYVTFTDSSLSYKVTKYKTFETKNLFALVGERCVEISKKYACIGYIIPLSGLSIDGFEAFQKIVYSQRITWSSFYSGDRNPSELFTGVKIRAGIYLSRYSEVSIKYVTKYIKYYAIEREYLFCKLNYVRSLNRISAPKLDTELGKSVFTKIEGQKKALGTELKDDDYLYYHAAPIYWCKALFDVNKLKQEQLNIADSYKKRSISREYKDFTFVLLNSSLFFYYWIVLSDCYNLTKKYISEIKVPQNIDVVKFNTLAKQLNNDIFKHHQIAEYEYKNKGVVRFAQFFPKKSKPIIDDVDKLLAQHYGFTEEELDFIINYDIKYRMGNELNGGSGE